MKRPNLDAVLDGLDTLFEGGTASGLSDGHLLERYLSRPDGIGEAAFAAIVKRHGPMVHRVCRGVLREWHDADDAFQATFLILARKASSIRAGGSVGSWLYGVARRVAIRARDERNRRTEREQSAGRTIAEDRAHCEQPELMPEVQEEIDRLPERYRATVVLCDLEGLTHEQAASALRVPVGTVKVRLSRGRERLRGRFARRGLAPEALAVVGQAPNPSSITSPPSDSTIRAAMRIAEGKAVGASAQVAALVQGALRAMFFARLKPLVLLLVFSVPVLLSATHSRSDGPRDQGPQPPGNGAAPRIAGARTGATASPVTEILKKSEFSRTENMEVTLEPIVTIDVVSSLPGKVKSLLVDVGDPVKTGQLLAEIDAPELFMDHGEAEAVFEKERARVNLAAARLSGIERNATEVKAGAKASVEEVKADYALARAELRVAETRLLRAEARVNLTRIVSPIDGVVTRRRIHAGEFTRGQADPSSPILSIADLSRLKADLYVPEHDLPFLDKGDPATLRPKTSSEDLFQGRIARIDVTQQPGNIGLRAEIEVDNPGLRLRPGQSALATLKLGKHPGVLTIPVTALFQRIGEPPESGDCYRVVNNIAFRTTVKLGAMGEDGQRIEVLSGLKEGDQVIRQPTEDIKDRQAIGTGKD